MIRFFKFLNRYSIKNAFRNAILAVVSSGVFLIPGSFVDIAEQIANTVSCDKQSSISQIIETAGKVQADGPKPEKESRFGNKKCDQYFTQIMDNLNIKQMDKDVINDHSAFIAKYLKIFKDVIKYDLSAIKNGHREKIYTLTNNIGTAFYYKKDYDTAYRYLEQAIKLNPKDPLAYRNLGLTLKEKAKKENSKKLFYKAIEFYKIVISLDKDYAKGYRKKAERVIGVIRSKYLPNSN